MIQCDGRENHDSEEVYEHGQRGVQVLAHACTSGAASPPIAPLSECDAHLASGLEDRVLHVGSFGKDKT